MFRMWVKEWENNHLLRDLVVEMPGEDMSRTQKVLKAVEQACAELDLQPPIWLESNIRDFQRMARTRFSQDSFIETLPFSFLEILMLEED